LATGLLDLLEKLPTTVGIPSGVGELVEVAKVVTRGLELVFGLNQVTVVAANRIEIGPTARRPRSFFAAFFAGKPVNSGSLLVEENRLKIESDDGTERDYVDTDFVLYSMTAHETRDDVMKLPFYPLYQKAELLASEEDEASWTRSKSYLLSLYQEMVLSPDLVRRDALRLFNDMKLKVQETRRLAKEIHDMPLVRKERRPLPQAATATTTRSLLNAQLDLLQMP